MLVTGVPEGGRRKGRDRHGRGSGPARGTWGWRAAGVLPLLLGLVPGSALTAQPASVAVSANWPKFHYNDAGSGYNPREHTLSTGNVARLTAKWALNTGGAIESSTAVVNGVVYIGSDDGDVYAVEAATGAKIWAHHVGGSVASAPAVARGVVYVGSTSGTMYALSAATGAKLWGHALGAAIVSSPAVAGGTVYVGPENDNFYALSPATGAVRWRHALDSFITSSPAVVRGVVYICSASGQVYALSAATGAKLWAYNAGLANYVVSSPAVAG